MLNSVDSYKSNSVSPKDNLTKQFGANLDREFYNMQSNAEGLN